MAYLNFLITTPEVDVVAIGRDPSLVIEPSLVVAVSHLIGYWVQVQPLGKLLGQAVDGGIVLNSELWHPLRPPVYHLPDAARALHLQLVDEWQRVLAAKTLPDDDWYRLEIEKVLRVYEHASALSECVVSVLERPADHERGSKVYIPFRLGEDGV